MLSSYRKWDVQGKTKTLGLCKGTTAWALDIMARRTGNDKWEKPVHKTYMKWLQKKYWDAGLYNTDAVSEITFGEYEKSDKTDVWIFWHQGWDTENAPHYVEDCLYQGWEKNSAPDIVKNCRKSTDKFLDREKYNIHRLDKDNYSSFVKFPEWIMKKVESGTINLTKFSNLLRLALLYRYGGIWMDATIFLTEPLDEKITDYRYFSIKTPPVKPNFWISFDWTTYFLATGACETKFFKELLTLQMEYWRREDYVMDYLLFDYLIALIHANEPDIAEEWAKIPENNVDNLFIEHSLNKKFDPVEWEEIRKKTSIFKVTYKVPLSDDPDTYYNRVVNSI